MNTANVPLASLNVSYLYGNEELSDGLLRLKIEKEGAKRLRKDDAMDKT